MCKFDLLNLALSEGDLKTWSNILAPTVTSIPTPLPYRKSQWAQKIFTNLIIINNLGTFKVAVRVPELGCFDFMCRILFTYFLAFAYV